MNDNIEALKDVRPSLPDLNDRAADNWELPLAIADLAGGDWPTRARLAAVGLSGDADAKAETIGVQLLAAIKAVFETLGTDRITSEHLAERLTNWLDRLLSQPMSRTTGSAAAGEPAPLICPVRTCTGTRL